MATVEAPIVDGIKQALIDTDERGTMHVMRTVNNTERVFKNPTAQEVFRSTWHHQSEPVVLGASQVVDIETEHPGEFDKFGHLVKGMKYKESFQVTGNTQDSVWSCGQSIGLIDDVPTCEVLIERIVGEAEAIITQRLQGLVSKL